MINRVVVVVVIFPVFPSRRFEIQIALCNVNHFHFIPLA